MAKTTNYLATPLERQRQFNLPKQPKITELMALTDKIKQAWTPLLPEEILSTLMVVKCEIPLLVITTTNHTIANHLNYTNKMLLEIIHQTYPYLQTISQLKFSVIAPRYAVGQHPSVSSNPLVTSVTASMADDKGSVNHVTSRKLSAATRQNITQLAQDVTLDSRLANILLRLAKED